MWFIPLVALGAGLAAAAVAVLTVRLWARVAGRGARFITGEVRAAERALHEEAEKARIRDAAHPELDSIEYILRHEHEAKAKGPDHHR